MSGMKAFLFVSLIASSLAEQLGYNYQPLLRQLPNSLGETFAVSTNYGGYQPQSQYMAPDPAPVESYNKQFYSFAAPEDEFVDQQAAHKIATAIQRNFRVIFIKTPSNKALEEAAVQLTKQISEDKTAIYVLNKQTDVGELAQKVSTVREQHNHKPVVQFVKYRTPEEAAHAQRYIQSHYDGLQGSSSNTDGGVAPVLNFASQQSLQGQGELFKISPATSTYGTGISSGVGASLNAVPSVSAISTLATSGSQGVGYKQGLGSYYGQVGSDASFENHNSAAFGAQFGGAPGDNAVYTGGYGNELQSAAVSSLNERISSGSKFVFPKEAQPSNAYLPLLKYRL